MSTAPRNGLEKLIAPRVFLLVLALKLYVLLVLYVVFLRTELRNGDKGFFCRPLEKSMEIRSQEVEESFWERLAPYDGQWYLDIAANGYRELAAVESNRGMHPPANYAFFPLLPLLIRGTQAIAPESFMPFVDVLLSVISALGAVVVWVLAREHGVSPLLAVGLLLAFPAAAFQSTIHTEGLFLLFSALTLLWARSGRLYHASAAGIAAGLCRPQGILLILVLLAEFVLPLLREKTSRQFGRVAWRTLLSFTPVSGFLYLAAASFWASGSPLSFLTIQGRWGRSYGISGFLDSITMAFGYQGPPVDLLGLVVGLALLPILWRRFPLSIALYGTGAVLLPLSTGSIMSFGRFMSVSIPHFLALTYVLQRAPAAIRVACIGAFSLAQVLLARGLIAWYLVG